MATVVAAVPANTEPWVMSLLKSLSRGSFFSDESLLQAREGYLPVARAAPADVAFAHWTRRVAVQHELSIAREMAGLPDAALHALAAEFQRAPRRHRTDWLRLCTPVGAALVLVGGLWLVLAATLQWGDATTLAWIETLAAACLALGVLSVSAGVLASFSAMSLEVGHGKVGLCTGLLDEQHPWLYKASLLACHPAADAYRQRVLAERGPLRGIDYLLMREIARADDGIELTRVARSVAEHLNRSSLLPAAGAGTGGLVALGEGGGVGPGAGGGSGLAAVPASLVDDAPEGADGEHPPVAMIRPFGSTPADRRRQG